MTPEEKQLLKIVALSLVKVRESMLREGMTITSSEDVTTKALKEAIAAVDEADATSGDDDDIDAVFTESADVELLPCPFCGGKPSLQLLHSRYFIACLSCAAEGPCSRDKMSPQNSWNDRPREVALERRAEKAAECRSCGTLLHNQCPSCSEKVELLPDKRCPVCGGKLRHFVGRVDRVSNIGQNILVCENGHEHEVQ